MSVLIIASNDLELVPVLIARYSIRVIVGLFLV